MGFIKSLRYGPENKDYFWINDTHPTMIMHPFRPQLDGKGLSESMDAISKASEETSKIIKTIDEIALSPAKHSMRFSRTPKR